jgi:Icc-related predicted phosphoesterase
MKICCISDTHNWYKSLVLDEGDILIHAGDWEAYQFSSQVKDFNNWLGKQPFKHKIIIAGNHDFYPYNNPVKKRFTNATYIENELIEIEGIKIWGSPITPLFNDWAFMAGRGKEIQRYWNMIPEGIDVLVTHGPPFGILDYTPLSKQNVGCEDLLKRVNEIRPKYHIFGHIHGSYGMKEIDNVTFINACVCDEDYMLTNEPIIVEI